MAAAPDAAVPLSAYLALKKELTEQNLARVNLLLQQSIEDDDAIPEGLDEQTANYLAMVTEKVKSNLLTLTEHHNADIGSLLVSLADEETKLSLVQAKLSTALNTIEEYRSENALKTSEMNNFKDNFAKLLASVRAIIPMEMTLHYPVTLISTFL